MVKIGLVCWKQGGGTNDYVRLVTLAQQSQDCSKGSV